jgi:hypothetical protein
MSPGKRRKPIHQGEQAMSQDIPSRRELLRGTLALGSGLCLPVLFSGCDSKYSGNPASTTSPAPAATITESAPAATNKVKKDAVQYQEQAKGDQKCGLCLHFEAASNSCKLVEGQISQDGWCILWTKKA